MLDRRLRRYRLFGRWWRPDAHRLRTIWRIGLPIGGTLLFEVGLFNAAAFVMGLFGAEALAAHAIALQIATLSFMVPLGLAQAGTVPPKPKRQRSVRHSKTRDFGRWS